MELILSSNVCMMLFRTGLWRPEQRGMDHGIVSSDQSWCRVSQGRSYTANALARESAGSSRWNGFSQGSKGGGRRWPGCSGCIGNTRQPVSERCELDGVGTSDDVLLRQFRLHLHRGISYLATPQAIRSIASLIDLAVKETAGSSETIRSAETIPATHR